MKKISIQKNGVTTNQVEMEATQADAWLASHIAMGTFGQGDVFEKQPNEITPAVYESQEILDVGDVSFDPPQFEDVLISEAVYEMESYEITPAVMEDEVEIEPAVMGERQKMYDILVSPCEYTVIEEDTTAAIANDLLKATKIANGKAARQACEDVLDLIAGFNLERALTAEQITQMQTTFSNAESALRASRPTMAKGFISSITPDEVLVTEEMKSLCLELLNSY